MLQVIQNYNTGELKIDTVPEPALRPGGMLVRTLFSLISAGTERSTVTTAQKSLLGKAQSRPDLVQKVLHNVKKNGLWQTVELVRNKLDTPVPLGYSSCGVIAAVAEDVDGFAPGDIVACAGQGYASHAETVFIPKNLAVKVPAGVQPEDASYTTLGAIAMQGVRQAQVTVGDKVAVIGLGLLGLITVQILKASGCRVVGIDLQSEACDLAKTMGADFAFPTNSPLYESIASATDGFGVDSAIITAASKDNAPVMLAGDILRNQGKLIILGAVPADIPRSPFYEKEIDIRFSRSYGPGRYDTSYEDQGLDYPYGYVRWTENRNMGAFLELLATGKMSLQPLTTHRFHIEDAHAAYDLITGKSKSYERYIGIVLEYAHRHNLEQPSTFPAFPAEQGYAPQDKVHIGFIGAGNFAQSSLLPVLKKLKKQVSLRGVSTSKGMTSTSVAKKFKFEFCTTDNHEILDHPDINCIFIATRHHLHAPYVIEALRRNKPVFVEKPLAISPEHLEQLVSAYESNPGKLMVGFNRRFAPTVTETRKFFRSKINPCMIHYRVNAGHIPREHWTQDAVEGGGRIIGEVCHFVDLMSFLLQARPTSVYAETFSGDRGNITNKDNVNITLKFSDGSLGTINYIAVGDKSFPKERIEIFGESSVAVIDDFKKVTLTRGGKTKSFGSSKQDKGYAIALQAFVDSIQRGSVSPIPFNEMVWATQTTFRILESISKGMPVKV